MTDFDAYPRLASVDFRSGGYLQEVNRRVLNPAGLCLTVIGDGAAGKFLVSVLDARADPEGFVFSFDEAGINPADAAEKADAVALATYTRRYARETRLGACVQPIPGRDESEPVTLGADDLTINTCIDMANEVAAQFVDEDQQADVVEKILLGVIGPLASRLRLHPGGVLHVGEAIESHLTVVALTHRQQARARYLARTLPEFAKAREIRGPNGAVQQVRCQLYASEVEEMLGLCEDVKSWPLTEPPETAPATFKRLEELYGLAQPGMLFWRGDKKVREHWETMKDRVNAQVQAWMRGKSDVDRFLAGDLSAADLKDPQAVRENIDERRIPMAEALAALDSERAALVAAIGPLDAAIGRLP